MNRKILAILVSLLFITMIPSVIGVNFESDIIDSSLFDERVWMKGLLSRSNRYPHIDI